MRVIEKSPSIYIGSPWLTRIWVIQAVYVPSPVLGKRRNSVHVVRHKLPQILW
jgi:hypothetical protein